MVVNSSTPPEEIIANSNPVFGLEVRGFEHIPDAERNMTLGQIGPMWRGANMNMFSISLGCVAIASGLSPWWAFAACVLGNLPYLYLGLASIGAARVGLPVTTLSRSVYGVRGNILHAALTWLASICFEALNTVFGVLAWLSLLRLMGFEGHSVTAKLIAVGVQLAVGGGVAVLGHATMVYLQRFFALALGIVLLAVLAPTLHGLTTISAPHGQQSALATAAAFMTACGVIASQPVSYLYNGPDWVRYLPADTSGPRIFKQVFWWTFIPCIVLTGMGVLWASMSDMSDPVAGLKPLLPNWLYFLFILAVIAGSVANNAPTFYSSGLSLQAAGLRLSRWMATALDIGVSTLLVVYILFVQDLTSVMNNFVAVLVAWSGPYAGVWLTDGILRGWRLDLRDIHAQAGSPGRTTGGRRAAWLAFAVGMAVAIATMKSPVFVGPIAQALGGMDLSWVLGGLVAGGVYAAAVTLRQRQTAEQK